MKKSLTLLVLLLLAHHITFAHKEWIHQYMVQRANDILRSNVGAISVLDEACGRETANGYKFGKGDDYNPWITTFPIAVGAWREDLEDPIYAYGNPPFLINGGTPSITHFWMADNGDEDQLNYLANTYNNAWQKAQYYLFGGRDLYLKYRGNVASVSTVLVRIRYNSLIELYKGNYTLVSITPMDGVEIFLNKENSKELPVTSIALQILGRVAHLLGDMNVPAHVMNHVHPCPTGIADYYENEMGGVWPNQGIGSGCEHDPGGVYPGVVHIYDQMQNITQQGLINEITCMSDFAALRFLFYSTNQLADFFPSGTNPSGGGSGGNMGRKDGNIYLPNETKNIQANNLINTYYSSWGSPPSNIDVYDQSHKTIAYAIRAQASLLYWFARKTGLITDNYLQTTSNIPATLTTTFNLASPDRPLLTQVTVNSPGLLLVNAFAPIEANYNEPARPPAKLYTAITSECLDRYILINQGGKFELGDPDATSNSSGHRAEVLFGNGSTLHISHGITKINSFSKLVMKSGSTLVLHGRLILNDNAIVEIQPGATLLWEPDGFLELNGDNAILDLKGKLILANNAVFSFTITPLLPGAPTINPGFIKFNTSTPFDVGTNARFVLQGSGPTDKIAEITINHRLQPSNWTDFDFFFENGWVDMKPNASIQFGNANVRLNNIEFKGDAATPYQSVYINGCGREYIRNSKFSGGNIGLSADLRTCNGSPIYLESVNFENCRIGLRTNGKSAKLLNCNFIGTESASSPISEIGWDMMGAEFPDSRVEGCTFRNLKKGIRFISSVGSELLYKSSQTTNNEIGLEMDGPGSLKASCGGIYYNNLGVMAKNDAVLNFYKSELSLVNNGIATTTTEPRTGLPAVNLSSNTIEFENASIPELFTGLSNFTGLDHTSAGIRGTLRNNAAIDNITDLRADNNKWHIQLPGNPVNYSDPVATNLSWYDVALYKITSTNSRVPIYVRDLSPLTSPQVCDVDPCVVPSNQYINLPCDNEIIVNNCPSCEVISNAYFSNEKLNSAIIIALSNSTRFNPNGDNLLALNMFKEILTTPLIDTTQEEAYVLLRAYEYMKAAYAWTLKTNQTNANASLSIMNSVSQQISLSSTNPAFTDPVLFAYMDQALASYSAGNLTASRSAINSALPLSRSHTAGYVGYWDCFINANEQLRDSLIDIYTYYDLVSNCSTNSNAQARVSNQEISDSAKLNIVPTFDLLPNPAGNYVSLQLLKPTKGELQVELIDLRGTVLYKKKFIATEGSSSNIDILLNSFNDGIYLIRLQSEHGADVKKLVISK